MKLRYTDMCPGGRKKGAVSSYQYLEGLMYS